MASQKIKIQSQSLLYVAIILGFVVVVNYLFSLKFLRLDLTDTKMYSVSKPTRNMLGKLDDIINIKVYFSKNLPSNLKKTETDVRDILSEYQAYARGHLKVSWEDPAESEETKRKVRALGIPEVQMQSFEKDKAQVVNGFSASPCFMPTRKRCSRSSRKCRTSNTT